MSEECCSHSHASHDERPHNGVANPAVLDALGQDPATGEVVLVMFEPRAWDGGDEQLFQLQEKLNAYLSFALDGELTDQLPQLAGRPVRLQLNCAEPPPAPVIGLLSKVREQIALQGIGLTVEGLPPAQDHGGCCGGGCGS